LFLHIFNSLSIPFSHIYNTLLKNHNPQRQQKAKTTKSHPQLFIVASAALSHSKFIGTNIFVPKPVKGEALKISKL